MSKNLIAALLMLLSWNAWSAAFNDNGNGTITDFATGLTWQQASAHNHVKRSQSAAIAYCDGLDLAGGGWRLPKIKELISIVDFRRKGPSISVTYFRYSSSLAVYWSSSSYEDDSNYGWAIRFFFGYADSYEVTSTHSVRCVR